MMRNITCDAKRKIESREKGCANDGIESFARRRAFRCTFHPTRQRRKSDFPWSIYKRFGSMKPLAEAIREGDPLLTKLTETENTSKNSGSEEEQEIQFASGVLGFAERVGLK